MSELNGIVGHPVGVKRMDFRMADSILLWNANKNIDSRSRRPGPLGQGVPIFKEYLSDTSCVLKFESH